MMNEKYFADDRPIIIPEYIKNISEEEAEAEIKKMEKAARHERETVRKEKRLADII